MDQQQRPPHSPEDARRLAETAADWAPVYCGFRLDFSPASLAELDRLLHGFHIVGGLQAQGALEAANEEGAVVVAWANLAGCYLGEVFIRNHGGAWRSTEETEWRMIPEMSHFPLVLELPSGVICSPLSKPFKVLDAGRAESLSDFYQAITSVDTETGRSRRGT